MNCEHNFSHLSSPPSHITIFLTYFIAFKTNKLFHSKRFRVWTNKQCKETMIGVTEYAIAHIYDYITKASEREFVLKLFAMEIYTESVRDFLNVDYTPLRLLDDPERGTIVEKLTVEIFWDWDHVIQLLSM